MNFQIKKIRLKELANFVQSETFSQLQTVPISVLRAKSYLENPNACPEDVVLYLGFIENQLVAFRSFFAGMVFFDNRQVRFAWCSGNWVHPEFRRKGFSEKLLNEAFADWDGKLMFTNYAPNSEKLYLKTGKFHSIHQFHGFRGYLFPKTRKLLPEASKNQMNKIFFSLVDLIISAISSLQILFFKPIKNPPDLEFKTISIPDEECYQLLNTKNAEHAFGRGEKELKWIFQFPWISNEVQPANDKYPFSSFSTVFLYQTVKIFRKNEIAGFFVFSVREGHLKTLIFCNTEDFALPISGFLKKYCVTNKIEILTVYNFKIAKQLFARKFPFLHAKIYGQKIYSSFEIKNSAILQFQDGDGDAIFT